MLIKLGWKLVGCFAAVRSIALLCTQDPRSWVFAKHDACQILTGHSAQSPVQGTSQTLDPLRSLAVSPHCQGERYYYHSFLLSFESYELSAPTFDSIPRDQGRRHHLAVVWCYRKTKGEMNTWGRYIGN